MPPRETAISRWSVYFRPNFKIGCILLCNKPVLLQCVVPWNNISFFKSLMMPLGQLSSGWGFPSPLWCHLESWSSEGSSDFGKSKMVLNPLWGLSTWASRFSSTSSLCVAGVFQSVSPVGKFQVQASKRKGVEVPISWGLDLEVSKFHICHISLLKVITGPTQIQEEE